jgi:hypothetical protein
VDWWFIYKVAAKKTADATSRAAAGDEYAYFDSDMARTADVAAGAVDPPHP